jgi:predicted GNAT family acetyltransferase
VAGAQRRRGESDLIMANEVRNNTALNRFELDVDGHLAVSYYRLAPGVITFTHTEVPPALGGRGVGSTLVRGALELVRAQGLKVVSKCPFVSAYLGKHPEFNDLLG